MAFIKSNFKALITALVMPHPRHEIPDKNFIGHPIPIIPRKEYNTIISIRTK